MLLRRLGKAKNLRNFVRFYNYFEKPVVKDNIALIKLNGPDKMNVLNQNLFDEAKQIFNDDFLNHNKLKAIVFMSSKKNNFIAGADINMLKNVNDRSEILKITNEGNNFFQKIKDKKIPLIAAINGSCMGGGLEWALYCDYRIATKNKNTIFSLPEVKLGLMPGMGGTYNLTNLIGLPNSLDIILTGKNIKFDKAKKLGIIDELVEVEELENKALQKATKIKLNDKKSNNLDLTSRLANYSIFRNYIFSEARKKIDKVTKGNMPAPYKIIETLKKNYNKNKTEYLKEESNSFADLIETKESKALIGLFTGSSEVKKHNFGDSKEVKNILVLGAGLMGSGIADVSSKKHEVYLKDNNEININISKSKLGSDKNISYFHNNSLELDKIYNSDVIIEAVYEDLEVKKKLLNEVEKIQKKNFIFASNTSAIPISKIAEDSKNAENVIGIHYFSPVQKMPLVEIIPHENTSKSTISTAYDIVSKQGKTPILVKDVPGFFVNRCLAPLLVELPELILDGVKLEQIEKSMTKFGMPVGPITLSDEVGIDISNHVSDFMNNSDLGVRMKGDTTLIKEMIENNWLGRKSGLGFYDYSSKNKKINKELINLINLNLEKKRMGLYGDSNIKDEEIIMRLIGKYVNEAAYCLQNDIINSPLEGDIGSVFGIGFPPHLGGPFRMIDQMGIDRFNIKMFRLVEKYGVQFQPAPILLDYEKLNKKFYS
jgi:enoyl-CoA hydratase/long-chain 3-hydroxyacyl-CoA dehydrogenase